MGNAVGRAAAYLFGLAFLWVLDEQGYIVMKQSDNPPEWVVRLLERVSRE